MNTNVSTANPIAPATAQSLLSSRAVLIRLWTSAFIGNPCDKALTSEVEAGHGTEAKRISVRKRIMQGKELNAVAASLQALRKTSEKLSAPWLDGGLRIVAAKSLIAAKLEIEAGIRAFHATVDSFIDSYDAILANDRKALNGTFNLCDYLTPQALRTRFAARLEILPIASDFRVEGIDSVVKAELEAEMNRVTAARVIDAKRDLVARIQETVSALSARLATLTKDSRFHDSTVTNIAEACAEVRAANFDGDATLDRLADTVEAILAPISPDSIKDSEAGKLEAKEAAVKALAEIAEAMAGFMG